MGERIYIYIERDREMERGEKMADVVLQNYGTDLTQKIGHKSIQVIDINNIKYVYYIYD